MSRTEESIQDIANHLAEEVEEEVVVKDPEEIDEPEEKDEEDEEESSEENEEGKEGTEKEGEGKGQEVIKFKEITAKYPNFFKDFPAFRHTLFQNEQYRELFPSMEDAKAAHEDVEGIRELEDALISGDEGDIAGVLDSMKELGEDVIPNFAMSFLPALHKMDQETYFNVVTPVFVNLVQEIYGAGISNENENLRNAALVVSQFLFRDQKVASGEKTVKLPERKQPKNNKEEDELTKERNAFRTERYTTLYNDVVHDCDSQLRNLVLEGMDPKNTMTEGMKDLVAERVVKEISKTLSATTSHTSKMNALWKKAGEANFSTGNKSRIVSAYLEAAREIMPRIRSKIRASALGIRDRQPENGVGKSERKEPKSTTGGGNSGKPREGGKERSSTNPKDIDWRKTSDIDLFRDNITFKK